VREKNNPHFIGIFLLDFNYNIQVQKKDAYWYADEVRLFFLSVKEKITEQVHNDAKLKNKCPLQKITT
jgi:hypothetical protein